MHNNIRNAATEARIQSLPEVSPTHPPFDYTYIPVYMLYVYTLFVLGIIYL